MKNQINKFLFLCTAVALLFGACKKKENKTYYNASDAKATIESSASSIVLTKSNADEKIITFFWDKPDFGYNATVSYSVLFDLPADSFTKTETRAVEAEQLSASYTVSQMNQLAAKFGMTADSVGIILVRLRAEVTQNGGPNVGKTDSLDVIFSEPIEIKVTPYSDEVVYPAIYAAGAFQGWDPGNGIPIYSALSNNKYEGYVNIVGTSGGDFEFKFTSQKNWDGPNFGSAGAPTTTGFITSGPLSIDGGAGNLTVPASGYYRMKVDATGLTYEAYQTTWGLIGDATPGGWDNSTALTYDATNSVWVIESVALTGGKQFKFRANNAWDLSYGWNADKTMLTADNGGNIDVEESGNYKVVLDLSNSVNYHFVLTKL